MINLRRICCGYFIEPQSDDFLHFIDKTHFPQFPYLAALFVETIALLN